MKREYSEFLEDFGDGEQYATAPNAVLDKYRGILPDSLLEIWQSQGWCSYGHGLFWTVNPDEYAWLVDGWIGSLADMPQDQYFVIARTAFGDFYCARRHGASVILISCSFAAVMAPRASLADGDIEKAIDSFFGGNLPEDLDLNDAHQEPMFEAARAALGPLKPNEMYGFVPMLPLGGAVTVDRLEKLDLGVHIDIIKQGAGIRLMTN
jgi:hypothetical protein